MAVIVRCLDISVFETPVDAALNVCAQVSCTQFLSMSLLIVVTLAILHGCEEPSGGWV